jgi:hypothetical protein
VLCRCLDHGEYDFRLWMERNEKILDQDCGSVVFVACSRVGSHLPTHVFSVCGHVHETWRQYWGWVQPQSCFLPILCHDNTSLQNMLIFCKSIWTEAQVFHSFQGNLLWSFYLHSFLWERETLWNICKYVICFMGITEQFWYLCRGGGIMNYGKCTQVSTVYM